jgi:hypothetical protein
MKRFPILWPIGARTAIALYERLECPRDVPWDLIAKHERQCVLNHGQSVETLASRGGLSPHEAVAVIQGKYLRYAVNMNTEFAIQYLQRLVFLEEYRRMIVQYSYKCRDPESGARRYEVLLSDGHEGELVFPEAPESLPIYMVCPVCSEQGGK